MTWAPFPGFQTEFCRRSEFEVLAGGAAGPGKTDCLIALALRRIPSPSFKGLLLRRTFPQLLEIIDRCHEVYPLFGGVYRSGLDRWTFPSGATIRLGHMQHEDDKRRYHGGEFQWIGFDELTEFTATQYLYVFSRMRSARDSDIPVQIRATTNPGGIGHNWVKERFVDITTPGEPYMDEATGLTRVFVPGQVRDNLALMEHDPGYIARLEAMPEIDRKRYLHGDWEVFEGQIFATLSQSTHGCEPFPIPPEWERFMVVDWGFARPFSVGWYAVDYDGVLYRYRAWYGRDPEQEHHDRGLKMISVDVAAGILKREDRGERVRTRIGDRSMWNELPEFRKKEAIGTDIAGDFQDTGCFLMKSDSDRLQGLQQVHKRLQVIEDVDEKTGEIVSTPQVRIFNDQPDFWRTMQLLVSDPHKPEDVNTKQEDHIFDEFRYACMHKPIVPKRVKTGPPAGSFQAERSRLIRAKQYARGHGCSLEQAYRKVS